MATLACFHSSMGAGVLRTYSGVTISRMVVGGTGVVVVVVVLVVVVVVLDLELELSSGVVL